MKHVSPHQMATTKAYRSSVAPWLIIVILSLLIHGGEFATISKQSELIDVQRGVISDLADTITDGEYKFASGFLAGCGSPCVIRSNPGGSLNDYEWLASLVNVRGQTVLIDGYCASACALFADHARANIRITDRASFWFHQTSADTDPPQSPDVAAWVKANGGFPSQASDHLTMMDFEAARRFWQPALGWQRIPFDLDAPSRWKAYPWNLAGLRGTIQ